MCVPVILCNINNLGFYFLDLSDGICLLIVIRSL